MTEKKTREQIHSILRECILTSGDKVKVKVMFEELMQDKAAWDKFLRIVVPSTSKSLEVVTEEDFKAFRKITMEEIDKWNPEK